MVSWVGLVKVLAVAACIITIGWLMLNSLLCTGGVLIIIGTIILFWLAEWYKREFQPGGS